MNSRFVFPMCVLALLSVLIVAFATAAQAQGMSQQNAVAPMGTPAMAMSSQQQAILAEAWTLTPQRSAQAGFTGLPLRNCEGLYCGVLSKAIGTQVDVLVDDRRAGASGMCRPQHVGGSHKNTSKDLRRSGQVSFNNKASEAGPHGRHRSQTSNLFFFVFPFFLWVANPLGWGPGTVGIPPLLFPLSALEAHNIRFSHRIISGLCVQTGTHG